LIEPHPSTAGRRRDYAPLLGVASHAGDRGARLQRVCDLLWGAFSSRGLSWIGFYAKVPDEERMTLLVRRDKPACSPIGLHGMCGRAWRERRPILVAEVTALGEGYIACDPRDRSEAVVPCFETDGSCWGVLDADSYEPAAFDEHDIAGMTALVEAFGVSAPQTPRPATLVL
jgi:putative methionine-R-sulfoxide reductase with GAF domain